MAYSTGTVGNAHAIATLLKDIAVASGGFTFIESGTFSMTVQSIATTSQSSDTDSDSVTQNLSNNWADRNGGGTTTTANYHRISKNGIGFSIISHIRPMIRAGVTDSYGAVEIWFHETATTGSPVNLSNCRKSICIAPLLPSQFAYYAFSEATPGYVYLAIEEQQGTFQHIGIGSLNKFTTMPGGEFAIAARPSRDDNGNAIFAPGKSTLNSEFFNAIEATETGLNLGGRFSWGVTIPSHPVTGTFDTIVSAGYTPLSPPLMESERFGITTTSNVPVSGMANEYTGSASGYRAGFMNEFAQAAVATYSNHHVMYPAYAGLVLSENSTEWGLYGQFPGGFIMSVRDFAPGEEFTLGGETFMAFPLWSKGDSSVGGEPFSYDYGMAFKKVV